MRLLLVATLFALAALAYADSWSEDQDYQAFKRQFGKRTGNRADEEKRHTRFRQNKAAIDQHNEEYAQGKHSFRMGINQFADMSHDEFVRKFTGAKQPQNVSVSHETDDDEHQRSKRQVYSPVDWSSRMNPIKNQQTCGSCWAFSTAGTLEGVYAAKFNKIISLSEQNLVDCARDAYGSHGCEGGWPQSVFKYVQSYDINKGPYYPYINRQNPTCKQITTYNAGLRVTSTLQATPSEDGLKKLLQTGPLSIAMYVSDAFQRYAGGIYTDYSCYGKNVNHAMILVGWGVDATTGRKFWKIRNTWDTTWGEKGYMRLAMDGTNPCQLWSFAFQPVLA